MVAVPVVSSISDSEECNKKKTACAHLHFPNEFHLDDEPCGQVDFSGTEGNGFLWVLVPTETTLGLSAAVREGFLG